MKISKSQLRQIIKEALASVLDEAASVRGTHTLGLPEEGELELTGDIPINLAGGQLAPAPWLASSTETGATIPIPSVGAPTVSATALPGPGISTSGGGKIKPYLRAGVGPGGLQVGGGARVSGENKPTFEAGAEGLGTDIRGKFSLGGKYGGATVTTPSTGGDAAQLGVHVNPLKIFGKGRGLFKEKRSRTEPEDDWSDVDALFGEVPTDDETAVNETLERWKKLIK